jgi:hypothetical protein
MENIIENYTKAININPINGNYFCNRSCAYWELKNFESAYEDI